MIHGHTFVLGLTFSIVFIKHVVCCTSDSKQLHICLNIYLERDYPQVEAILKALWQYSTSTYNRGHVLLEGPSLNDICRKIAELELCFSEVAEECITYTHIYWFDRLMRTLLAIDNLFCSESKDNLKALLATAFCVRNVRLHTPSCQDETFEWDTIWKGMLRLQIGNEICKPLEEQTHCLVKSLRRNQCGPNASSIYNKTISTWLNAWCSACSIQTSSVLMVISLITHIAYSAHL